MGVAAAIVGSALLGSAATAYSVQQQKKAAQKQTRRLKQQEEQAKTEARERAGLDAARDESGAAIQLGRGEAATQATSTGAGSGGATSRDGSVGARVGGMGQPGRMSRRVGL